MTKRILGLMAKLLPALALSPCIAQADTRALPTVVSGTVNVIAGVSLLETSVSSMSSRLSASDVQGQAALPLLMLFEVPELSGFRDTSVDVPPGAVLTESGNGPEKV